nr:fimbria/pilus outer membrane usher protein [Serratia sp. 14-2641]
MSYSVMQGWSNGEDSSTSTLNAGYQGSRGMVNGGYSYSSSNRSLNLGGNGAVLVHPEGVTLGQMLGSSVAVVSAPGAAGTQVMNGGNVRTDSRGYAVVPYLSNYQTNNISLNPSTLPDDVDMTQSSLNVYPTKGAVVLANFATRVGYHALVTLPTPRWMRNSWISASAVMHRPRWPSRQLLNAVTAQLVRLMGS